MREPREMGEFTHSSLWIWCPGLSETPKNGPPIRRSMICWRAPPLWPTCSAAYHSAIASKYGPTRRATYQTLALADNVDAASNLFLGRELKTRSGSLDDGAMESATRKVMGRLNPNFRNFKTPVVALSGGQRQSVAIARAIHFNARILIMDEPTAALGPAETAQVRDLIKQLKAEGIGIFLISHDIHDVFDLADRISVMLHGKLVGTVNKTEVTTDEVLGMIIMGKLPGEATQRELAELHG